MNYKFWFAVLCAMLAPAFSMAQINSGAASLGQMDNSWKKTEAEQKTQPLPQFVDSSGRLAMKTIFEAEQVFCYEVFPQDPDYNGYTLEGFPIRGFCGVLNKEVRDVISKHFFALPEVVDFEGSENCVMQPKIILRFVHGVDYADVLLSSPCHAVAIFYGGGVSAYNYKPGAEVIDTMLNSLKERHQDFVSPALLNQVLPIGVIRNAEQRKMISKNNEPIRKWEVKAKENVKKQEEELKKQSTGWNKLKSRM